MNFWLIDVSLTHPVAWYLWSQFDFPSHVFALSVSYGTEKLKYKKLSQLNSSEIRWEMFEEIKQAIWCQQWKKRVERKEEEKHATVIDVISHNRRQRLLWRKKNPLACIFNVPLCISPKELHFLPPFYFLFLPFFVFNFVGLVAYGYGLMRRRRSRKGKLNLQANEEKMLMINHAFFKASWSGFL